MPATNNGTRNGTTAKPRSRKQRRTAVPDYAELLAAERPSPEISVLVERATLLLGAAQDAFQELAVAHRDATCCAKGPCTEARDAEGSLFACGLVFSLISGSDVDHTAYQASTRTLIAALKRLGVRVPREFDEGERGRPLGPKPDLRAEVRKLKGIRLALWNSLKDGPMEVRAIAAKLNVPVNSAFWVVLRDMLESNLVIPETLACGHAEALGRYQRTQLPPGR